MLTIFDRPRRCPGRVLNRCWTRRATGADSGAVNANSSVANSAGSSADSSRATQPVKEEARVEEPRRRGGEVTSRRDKETGGDGAARQRGSRKGADTQLRYAYMEHTVSACELAIFIGSHSLQYLRLFDPFMCDVRRSFCDFVLLSLPAGPP